MATTATNPGIVNNWSLIAFARSHGKMQVGQFTNSETGETFEYYTDRVPTSYHGTGDIFSSVVVGALTRGKSLSDAFRIACDYTKDTIAYTHNTPGTNAYGVDFEVTLPKLVEMINS